MCQPIAVAEGPKLVEHTRRVVKRTGDEEHEQNHEFGHGDLDRTGLSEGALPVAGLLA